MRTEMVTEAHTNLFKVGYLDIETLGTEAWLHELMFAHVTKGYSQVQMENHSVDHLFSFAESWKSFKTFCRTSLTDDIENFVYLFGSALYSDVWDYGLI